MRSDTTLFTIGHSNHPGERFRGLLHQHGIELLADVRSTPFSRFNPQFNRARLETELRASGIRYEFLGRELGARSDDPACYIGNRVSYAKLAAAAPFKRGLGSLFEFMTCHRTAVMCAEREPLDCHRTILVGREVQRVGATVLHILADGSLEENQAAMARLIKRLELSQDDLFRSDSELVDAAYEAQAARIAYSIGGKPNARNPPVRRSRSASLRPRARGSPDRA